VACILDQYRDFETRSIRARMEVRAPREHARQHGSERKEKTK
jgi:hypothetical protein